MKLLIKVFPSGFGMLKEWIIKLLKEYLRRTSEESGAEQEWKVGVYERECLRFDAEDTYKFKEMLVIGYHSPYGKRFFYKGFKFTFHFFPVTSWFKRI